MRSLTLTVKVKLYPTPEQISALSETLSAVRDARNFASSYVFEHRITNYPKLHLALYYTIREQFGLRSQMTQSTLKTVLAKYRSVESGGRPFTRISFSRYEYDLVWNRDYSLKGENISMNTLSGRQQIAFESRGIERCLYLGGHFGIAKLIHKNRKWFLYIPVTMEVEEPGAPAQIVGIDLGVNQLAVTYDSNGKSVFYSGRQIKQKRARMLLLRKRLQARGTKSAKRKLKKLREKESRYAAAVNHAVTKALISQYGAGTLYVLEDLTGVRGATERVCLKKRPVTVSWAFYQFRKFLEYKAELSGSKVIAVDPAYTSQDCPVCGHRSRKNRNRKKHEFCCCCCGYQSNDDRIGAMNLWKRGDASLLKEVC